MFSLDQQIQILTSWWMETFFRSFWESKNRGQGNKRLKKTHRWSTFWEM